jgi:glutaredoxin
VSPNVSRHLLTVYSKPDCHLCAKALEQLGPLSRELDFEVAEQDITADDALHRAYFERIPVLLLDGVQLCEYFVDEDLLRERLRASSRVTDR